MYAFGNYGHKAIMCIKQLRLENNIMTHLLRALVVARAFVRAPHPAVFLMFVERVLSGGCVGGSSFLLHVALIQEKRLLLTHRFSTATYIEVTAGAIRYNEDC